VHCAYRCRSLVPTATSRSCRACPPAFAPSPDVATRRPHRRIRSSRLPHFCTASAVDALFVVSRARLPPAACNQRRQVPQGRPRHRRFRLHLRSPGALPCPSQVQCLPHACCDSESAAALPKSPFHIGWDCQFILSGLRRRRSALATTVPVDPNILRNPIETPAATPTRSPFCDTYATSSPLCGRLHGSPRPAPSGRRNIGGDNGTWHVQCRLPRPARQRRTRAERDAVRLACREDQHRQCRAELFCAGQGAAGRGACQCGSDTIHVQRR